MVINFTENEILTTPELYKKLGICKKTWCAHKETILEMLSEAWEYKIVNKGNRVSYHFIKKHFDFEYAKGQHKNAQKNRAILREAIIDVVQNQLYQTAASIDRTIKNNKKYKKVQTIGYAEGTQYEYTRKDLKYLFAPSLEEREPHHVGYINGKIWCKEVAADHYVPMTEQEKKDFFNFLKNTPDDEDLIKYEASLLEEYEMGVMDKKEINSLIAETRYDKYKLKKHQFYLKYGYTPQKVLNLVFFDDKKTSGED